MYTAMYLLAVENGRHIYRNCRIGGYKDYQAAIRAIKRCSNKQTGLIQIGQRLVSIVVNGREQTAELA